MLKLVRRVTDGVVAAQPKSMVRAIQSMARTSRGTTTRRRPGSQTPVSSTSEATSQRSASISMSCRRPVVRPPLPPHITMKQAKAYLEALIKGDADALEIVKASAKQMWAKVRA